MKKCRKCGGRVIEDLIDYKTKILGEDVVIDKVDGYRCIECGYSEIDESIATGLQTKILEKKLKIQKDKIKHYKPLLINNIRRVRESKRIPQKYIGEALGYSEQRFGAIERNDNTPIVITARLIAYALEVPMEELYDVKYVTKEFYDKIKNLRVENMHKKDGNIEDIEFSVIEELVDANKEFEELEEKINRKLAELRKAKREDKYFQDIRKTEKEIRELVGTNKKGRNRSKVNNETEGLNDEVKELVKKKKQRIETFKQYPSVLKIYEIEDEIKSLKALRNSALERKRKIENDQHCILKQSACIDGEIFEVLKQKFAKEYNTMYTK